jgi:hypothetical protein
MDWHEGDGITCSVLVGEERGSGAVLEGDGTRSTRERVQKQGVAVGWMPAGPTGRVAEGSFKRSESTVRRTNGHGSISDFCN